MKTERLYVVQWSDDGTSWWVLWDEQDGRMAPAAYQTVDQAEHRRSAMAEQFADEASYRVVGYEHPEED